MRIAVIVLPKLANATDFAPLCDEAEVELVFAAGPLALRGADVVVLPGTKRTLDARQWLRRHEFDAEIRSAPLVFGICGGLQILGRTIDDPLGVEGGGAASARHDLRSREGHESGVRVRLRAAFRSGGSRRAGTRLRNTHG